MEDTFDLPKLTVVYLFALMLLAVWLVQTFQQNILRFRRTTLDLPLCLFLVVSVISVIYSIEPRLSFFGAYKIYVFGWLPTAGFVLLYWMTAQATSGSLARSVGSAALAAAALASLYGWMQYIGWEIFDRMPLIQGGRVWSSLGNPLYLGAVCAMALPLALSRYLADDRRSFLAGGAMMMLIPGLALSLSRSAWLGAIAGSGVVLLSHRHTLRRRLPFLIFFMAGLLLIGGLTPSLRHRASALFSLQEGSNAARLEGWRAGIEVWKRHPWFGAGPDTFFEAARPYRTMKYVRATGPYVTQADAHNDLIQVASTEGVFGLAMLLWILWVVLKRALSSDPLGLGAALVALIVQNQFNFSSVASTTWAAIFAGLVFSDTESDTRPISTFGNAALAMGLALCLVGFWFALRPVRADVAYKEGLAWSESGQYMKAAESYERAAALNGRIEAYQTGLANAYRSLAQLAPEGETQKHYFDAAWEIAERTARAHPSNPDAWNNRGVAAMWLVQLAHRDLINDARQSFEKAVQLDPLFVDAWANLAKWEHLAGHLEKEKELWKKVIDIDPAHPMGRQVLGKGIVQ